MSVHLTICFFFFLDSCQVPFIWYETFFFSPLHLYDAWHAFSSDGFCIVNKKRLFSLTKCNNLNPIFHVLFLLCRQNESTSNFHEILYILFRFCTQFKSESSKTSVSVCKSKREKNAWKSRSENIKSKTN